MIIPGPLTRSFKATITQSPRIKIGQKITKCTVLDSSQKTIAQFDIPPPPTPFDKDYVFSTSFCTSDVPNFPLIFSYSPGIPSSLGNAEIDGMMNTQLEEDTQQKCGGGGGGGGGGVDHHLKWWVWLLISIGVLILLIAIILAIVFGMKHTKMIK
jgi:hypothetical protein